MPSLSPIEQMAVASSRLELMISLQQGEGFSVVLLGTVIHNYSRSFFIIVRVLRNSKETWMDIEKNAQKLTTNNNALS